MADYRKEITRYTIFWTMADYSKKITRYKIFWNIFKSENV
jgi:hypothetical protein